MNLIEFYRDELKARPLMPALLAQANIDVPPNRLIRAPEHVYPDTHPSIFVYPEHLVDYGDDNKGYDLLAVAREWLDLDLEQAVALLATLAGLTPPSPFKGEVRKASFRPVLPGFRRDPNEYATFAARAQDSLACPTTPGAICAAEYLVSRELYGAALHYRCGVADAVVPCRLPHPVWKNMITLPTWLDGSLLALKGRNTLPKGAGREMRNLSGAATAPYGLREMTRGGAVLVVEGETDVLSVWTAFEGEVNVIGIPGATHWQRLQHPLLTGRRLFLCLDAHEDAGRRAMTQARMWAADEGRPLTVIPGIPDKNDLLVREGATHLRDTLRSAIKAQTRRASRSLS